MYTFTTARNRAECEQTVYIKKGGEKKKNTATKKYKLGFFFFSGDTLGFKPLPHHTY